MRAVRSGQPIRIATGIRDQSELPPMLMMLIGERAPSVLRGAGLSLGLIAGRVLGRGMALAGVASGGALMGASALSFAIGAILRIYAFRVAPRDEPDAEIVIEGEPRLPQR